MLSRPFTTKDGLLNLMSDGKPKSTREVTEIRFLSHWNTPRTMKQNKAQLVLNFLRENHDRAFYSIEIAARLKESGVKTNDVGVNLRRYEKRGPVYFRGYRNAEHETPFAAGYIVTCVDPNKPRETAIAEATERTELLLEGGSHANPLADRIRMIRDELLKTKQLKEIVSISFPKQKLHCNEDQMRTALDRAYDSGIIHWLVFDKEHAARSQQGQRFGDENVNSAKET